MEFRDFYWTEGTFRQLAYICGMEWVKVEKPKPPYSETSPCMVIMLRKPRGIDINVSSAVMPIYAILNQMAGKPCTEEEIEKTIIEAWREDLYFSKFLSGFSIVDDLRFLVEIGFAIKTDNKYVLNPVLLRDRETIRATYTMLFHEFQPTHHPREGITRFEHKLINTLHFRDNIMLEMDDVMKDKLSRIFKIRNEAEKNL